MERKSKQQESSLEKLIEILNIVELDFECLSCNKVKGSFLKDLTGRMKKKVNQPTETSTSFNKPSK